MLRTNTMALPKDYLKTIFPGKNQLTEHMTDAGVKRGQDFRGPIAKLKGEIMLYFVRDQAKNKSRFYAKGRDKSLLYLFHNLEKEVGMVYLDESWIPDKKRASSVPQIPLNHGIRHFDCQQKEIILKGGEVIPLFKKHERLTRQMEKVGVKRGQNFNGLVAIFNFGAHLHYYRDEERNNTYFVIKIKEKSAFDKLKDLLSNLMQGITPQEDLFNSWPANTQTALAC